MYRYVGRSRGAYYEYYPRAHTVAASHVRFYKPLPLIWPSGYRAGRSWSRPAFSQGGALGWYAFYPRDVRPDVIDSGFLGICRGVTTLWLVPAVVAPLYLPRPRRQSSAGARSRAHDSAAVLGRRSVD